MPPLRSVHVLLGALAISLFPAGCAPEAPARRWVQLDDAAPIVMVQRAIVGQLIVADFADPNVEKIVASLRVVQVENDIGVAAAGVLSIPGVGAWPVSCEIE